MAKGKQMKVLEDKLDLVRREIEKFRAQESLLLEMMQDASGEPKATPRARRSNVKQTVIGLLEQVGDKGMNAASAVELAASAGINLERGSVSSLLSRLKNEGVIEYDGNTYRLARAKPTMPGMVHPIRTSGGNM